MFPRENSKSINKRDFTSKDHFEHLKGQLLDPQAIALANQVRWQFLNNVSTSDSELYPIAISGKGPPVLLIHGFDSNFLEFRRLASLLDKHFQLFIPDLFGFGFCPRPKNAFYGKESLIHHLNAVLNQSIKSGPVGLIGASMGGAAAIELARLNPKKVNRLLLLSPAGLTGHPMPVPPPLDQLGVWFLKQKFVRKSLCRQAFANPNINVGTPEEQIASLHLCVPGWGRSLAAFARSGGLANLGKPLPSQPLTVLWGKKDRILTQTQKTESINLLGNRLEELEKCGHLPHLDLPNEVAKRWLAAS